MHRTLYHALLLVLLSASAPSLHAQTEASFDEQQRQVIEQMMMERMLLSATGNSAIVQQVGQGNVAGIYQGGAGNQAEIVQRGNHNTTEIEQRGDRNRASVSVEADRTQLRLEQLGDDHRYELDLDAADSGRKLGTIRQEGVANSIVEVGTARSPVSIEQRGSGMKLLIEHHRGY